MDPENQAASGGAGALEGGNYELLRERLKAQSKALKDKADALNARRLQIYGRTEQTLAGNVRVRTENNGIPRDIIQVGGQLLFGYNVFLGLKTHTSIQDVMSLHTLEATEDGFEVHDLPTGPGADVPEGERTFLQDPAFEREFAELYQFYKDAKLLQIRRIGDKILAIFQISERIEDLKVFRWAVSPTGEVSYIDNRGERDHVFPPSHDFEWIQTTREDQVQGRHPHVSILDTVFVETIGGDLTLKVEDNTEAGEGIYAEPVEDAYQSLDDADIQYAALGAVILLKIKPYREDAYRYLVYNSRTQSVDRIDAIGEACILLPEDHGFIFPGGYYLQSGETKRFDVDARGMEFKRRLRSPNGEDVLYVFHRRGEGLSILLTYNMIQKEVLPPIFCNGYGLYPDGRLVVFKAQDEASRVHPMQIWRTPFFDEEHTQEVKAEGYLAKLGNAELVRGISDLHSLYKAVQDQSPTIQIYEDLIHEIARVSDNYHWMDHEEAGALIPDLRTLHGTVELIVDEYEKILTLRRRAEAAVKDAQGKQRQLLLDIRPDAWETVDRFVDALTRLRQQRGHTISLKELKYVDVAALDALEAEALTAFERLSRQTVAFLLGEGALGSYKEGVDAALATAEEATKTQDLKPALESLKAMGEGLNLLTEVVSGLKVEDATQRTGILDAISEVFAQLNRARAIVDNRRSALLSKEGQAEFAAEFTLFSQSLTGALAQATTPDACDAQAGRLMVQLEELEARFSEFDAFLAELTEKREEVFEAFEAKKQGLVEARQRRAQGMMQAAERILSGVARRAHGFTDLDALNTFFASDPMVLKVKDLAAQLSALGESVKSDEVESKLKSARQDAIRAQRDKSELFEEGAAVIRLGRHRFSVNTQPLELTLLLKDGVQHLHLSGTDFFEPLTDPALEASRPYWSQTLASESEAVYRGEFLAYAILQEALEDGGAVSLKALLEAEAAAALGPLVRERAAERYEEGYERGVHDHDGALILGALVRLFDAVGLLRYAPSPRALGVLFLAFGAEEAAIKRWGAEARSLGRLRSSLGQSAALKDLGESLALEIAAFAEVTGLGHHFPEAGDAGAYLAEELAQGARLRPALSEEARRLAEALNMHLDRTGSRRDLVEDLRALEGDLPRALSLLTTWLRALIAGRGEADKLHGLGDAVPEAAVYLLTQGRLERAAVDVPLSVELRELLGQHPRIKEGRLTLRLDRFLVRLGHFKAVTLPGYKAYRALRQGILDANRERLRLSEFQPRIMSAFVRNQLINDVYLPLIGDNLAKQMGALGDGRRTDLMGILLLISPPGYGKTTLMEYVANRLGLIFMKINGPALGHGVTSLDPAEAPSATARQEVEKLNLALEMGNNVMIYLDDIQHTHPELLQKFISLCDAQRKIEGVWRGKSRTYDLRGKKVCVVMAGNPYTESGDRFQIPDMLSNRADTYNLGDILGGKDDAFALSYIENSLTSNPALAPLATREQKDVYTLLRMAQGEEIPASELSHDYSAAELGELKGLFQKLFKVQALLLKVNQTYILSASQEDAYRTEPPFKLQGSYRNMNKIAEKVVSAMNDGELERVLTDHYVAEAQTLTTGAEANLLKLSELRGKMTPEQAERWGEIKKTYGRIQAMGDGEEDPVNRVVGQLSSLVLMVEQLGNAMDKSAASLPEGMVHLKTELMALRATLEGSQTPQGLGQIHAALGALQATLEGSQTPQGLGQIHEALAGLQETLEGSQTPQGLGQIHTALGALQATLEGSQTPQGLGHIHAALGRLQATLEGSQTPQGLGDIHAALGALQETLAGSESAQRLVEIRGGLAHVAQILDEAKTPAALDEIRAGLHALQHTLKGGLEAQSARNDALPDALQATAGAIAQRLGSVEIALRESSGALAKGSLTEAQALARQLAQLSAVIGQERPGADLSPIVAGLQGLAAEVRALTPREAADDDATIRVAPEKERAGGEADGAAAQDNAALLTALDTRLGDMTRHLDLIARILFSDWRARKDGKQG